jgi:hypothetical protein
MYILNLNLNLLFYRSLGLAIPPRIRFLQRKQLVKNKTENKLEMNKYSNNSEASEEKNKNKNAYLPSKIEKNIENCKKIYFKNNV